MSEGSKLNWIPVSVVNRRQFIVGGTAVAVLAACGGDDDPSAVTGESSATASSTASEPTASATASESAEGTGPVPGGILRVGAGGGAADILDAQHIISKSDITRQVTTFEPLMSFSPDYVPEYTNGIAQDVTANAADNYTIKLKDGVKFSNGNLVTADDVIYSMTRCLDVDLALYGGAALRPILEASGLTKIDDQTVQVQLMQDVSNFKEALCAYVLAIVPVGYQRFDGDVATQVGTGPYMLTEFEIGKKSVHVRNPHYWDTGKPYFDEVHIFSFGDGDSMLAALLADQIDVAGDISAASMETVGGTDGYATVNAAGGSWLDFVMAVDQEPFTDVRVRQAFRLMVDRPAMVEQVLAGYGSIANDLFSPLDANYAKELPQRVQDLPAAMALLAEAGQSDLVIDLFTTPDTAALVDMCHLFAEQAKGAGVTVNVQVLDSGTYWGDEYLKRTFAVDYWGTRNFLPQVAASSLPTAPYPGDHWPPEGSTFIADYNAALAETDEVARKVITDKMQLELYEEGGLIIPFFQNLLDGYNTRVHGLVARANTLNLDHYGRGFKNLYFAE